MSNTALDLTSDRSSVFAENEWSSPFFEVVSSEQKGYRDQFYGSKEFTFSGSLERDNNLQQESDVPIGAAHSQRSNSTNISPQESTETDQSVHGKTTRLREANRQLTRQTLLPKESELVRERNNLVRKKYKETFSKKDVIRLRYIEWQLDRIEDAIVGDSIDYLESLVESQEQLAQTVEKWADVIKDNTPVKAQQRRRRR